MREETHGQLLRESQTDYLTRLGNRRWFFEQGQRLIDDGRGREPLAVLAFDLDQFKSINDRYGHQTGDLVLKSFADIARGVLGPAVLLARIGGEEFAAVLAGNDARHAVALGEDVARRFAETLSSRVDSLGIPATVSIGLAQYEHDAPALAQGCPPPTRRCTAPRRWAATGWKWRSWPRAWRPIDTAGGACMAAHQAGASGDRRRPPAASRDASRWLYSPRPEHGTVLHHVPFLLADVQPGRLLVRTPQ